MWQPQVVTLHLKIYSWTLENNTDVPRMNINDQYTNRLTDRFLTSQDYLSLQNITLGYTLPKSPDT